MIIVAVGGNLPTANGGDVGDTFAKAAKMLEKSGVATTRQSGVYQSPAWPPSDQPDYSNAVWSVATDLDSAALLEVLHEVEKAFGRDRAGATVNAARTLDLDLIDFEGRVSGGRPVTPHPRMHSRAFVLLPLAEIAPDWRHPVSRRSVSELVAMLPDDHACRRIGEHP